MRRNFQDPQGAAEIFRAKLEAAVAEFNVRTISDDVFSASLYALGFRANRLREEFRYYDELRHANSLSADAGEGEI